MNINKYYLLLLLIFFQSLSYSETEITQKSEIQAYEYYRHVAQKGLSERDHSFDTFLRVGLEWHGLNGSESNKEWRWEFKPEVYGYYGDSPSTDSSPTLLSTGSSLANFNDPYQMNIYSPPRFFHWRKNISNKKQWVLETEKLNISYLTDRWELTAGRKPFSLGVLKIFPVWNKFSKPLPISNGPAATWGSDLISLRMPRENSSYLVALIGGETRQDDVILGEYTSYQADWEAHLLVAKWWEKNLWGIALTKDLWGASWKWESLSYRNPKDSNDHGEVNGFGAEYAMSDKSSFITEFLVQSRSARSKKDYFHTSLSNFEVFHAYFYNFTQYQYKVTDLLTAQLALLSNGVDGSQYWSAKAQYSFSDQTDYFAEINLPNGQSSGEFSQKVVELPGGRSWGSTTQASIGFKSVF